MCFIRYDVLKPRTILSLLVLAALTACSSTKFVDRKSSHSTLSEIGRLAGGKMATLELVDNQTYYARDLSIDSDSVFWQDWQTGQLNIQPISNLKRIEIRSHSRGAIDGLAIGSGVGAFGGFMVLASIGSEDINVTRGEQGALGAIIFGGIGSVLGVSIGAAVGSKYEFVFKDTVEIKNIAQIPLKSPQIKIPAPPKYQPHDHFYVELFGNALLYSLNYERLLGNSFVSRIGFMYAPARQGKKALLIPISISKLTGDGNKKLEFGLGAVFSRDFDLDLGVYPESGWSGRLTLSLGYRNEPNGRGFLFRAGPTLVFGKLFGERTDESYFPWFGLSFGYAF